MAENVSGPRTWFRAHAGNAIVAVVKWDGTAGHVALDTRAHGSLVPGGTPAFTDRYPDEDGAKAAADAMAVRLEPHACAEPLCWAEWRSGVLAAPVAAAAHEDELAPDATRRLPVDRRAGAAERPERRAARPVPDERDIVYTQDLSGRFTSVSGAVERILGYTPEETMQLRMEDLVLPEDRPELQRMFRFLVAASDAQPYQLRVHRKDGAVIMVEVTSWVVREKDQPVRLRGTARRVRWADSRPSERLDRTVREFFDDAPVGLYRTTPGGRILLVNRTLLRMLGYASAEELAMRNLESDFEAEYQRAWFRERLEREGEIRSLMATWTMRDGRRLRMRESAVVVRGPSGEALFYDGMVERVADS